MTRFGVVGELVTSSLLGEYFGALEVFFYVVGITAAATLRQVQRHTSAKIVKRLCVARLKYVGAP